MELTHLTGHPAAMTAMVIIGIMALGGLAYCAREAWRHWHHTNALPPAHGRSNTTQAQRLREQWKQQDEALHPTNAA